MTKLLTALAIAQFVLIGFLFARVVSIESTLENRLNTTLSATPSTAAHIARPSIEGRALTLTSLDESALRAIIREEFAAIQGSAIAETAAVPDLDPQQELDFDSRLEEVRQTIDFYAQTGEISRTEMEQLQFQIAKLRPADREAMLGRLIRELNSGAIDGRL